MPLENCTETDQNHCKEECRREFADGYTYCVQQCISGRCVDAPIEQEPSPDLKRNEQRVTCIEFESVDCDKECTKLEDRSKPRCRRSCLERQCPNANQVDLAKESLDPGTMRCSRCRDEFVKSCQRDCGLGLSVGGSNSHYGLHQLGCEKLCVSAACGESCGLSLP